jgi:hypothetical protein
MKPALSQSICALRESPRIATPGRCEKDTAASKTCYRFRKQVLNTTQEQVVSALHNLGVPFVKAQKTVIEASEGKPGIDFDSLFRACLPNQRSA